MRNKKQIEVVNGLNYCITCKTGGDGGELVGNPKDKSFYSHERETQLYMDGSFVFICQKW